MPRPETQSKTAATIIALRDYRVHLDDLDCPAVDQDLVTGLRVLLHQLECLRAALAVAEQDETVHLAMLVPAYRASAEISQAIAEFAEMIALSAGRSRGT